jgi:iron(III) transport system ATP-binding protein
MARLEISNLAKTFNGASVLNDVSFSVASRSLIAILGASGSGKTTLLRLIAGFETPDAGEIKLGGILLASGSKFTPPEQRGIGYVAQEGALFPHLCVADNITFGLPRADRRARHRVAELLTMVDLPASYADRGPQSLSGGEQQRVALARALAPNPKLLLLDEPFSALDAGLRAETRQAVAAAIHAAGATAILVTHDQEEALSMGAEVGVLQQGRLAQMSTPQTLYRQPTNAALANFVGEAVFLPGNANAGRVNCALGELNLSDGSIKGAVQIMVRPEQIRFSTDPASGGIAASVEEVTFYGHDAVIRFALSHEPPGSTVTARAFSQALPAIGSAAWLGVQGVVVAFPAALEG